jgi:cell division protein FtsW (lipid II flippase)
MAILSIKALVIVSAICSATRIEKKHGQVFSGLLSVFFQSVFPKTATTMTIAPIKNITVQTTLSESPYVVLRSLR